MLTYTSLRGIKVTPGLCQNFNRLMKGVRIYTPLSVDKLREALSSTEPPDFEVIGCFTGTKLIGIAMMSIQRYQSDKHGLHLGGMISHLRITEARRGKVVIKKTLIQRLIAYAKERNVIFIRIAHSHDMHGNPQLYTRMGFTVYTRDKKHKRTVHEKAL